MLEVDYTLRFQRDVKRLKKKHINLDPLIELVDLVIQNTPASLEELKRHHNMHDLKGEWAGSRECHVANFGDWLVIWREDNRIAVFQRTGSHDELFE